MAAPPSGDRPTLDAADESSIRVRFKLPPTDPAVTFFIVSFKVGASRTFKKVDALTNRIVDKDATAFPASQHECIVRGLVVGTKYAAKIRFGNSNGWGADSAESEPLSIQSLKPMAPAAPLLEVVSETSIKVCFAEPPEVAGKPHTAATIVIQEEDNGDKGPWRVVDGGTLKLSEPGCPGSAIALPGSQCVVTGLDCGKVYRARMSVMNACGWGATSADSEPLCIKHFSPKAPAAPLLEVVSETSIKVCFTEPPKVGGEPHTYATIFMRANRGAFKAVDGATCKLGGSRAVKLPCTHITVQGLAPATSYVAKIVMKNASGWGDESAESESVRLPDHEVEITGGLTWEQRDAQLRKRAIDVDDTCHESRTVSRLPQKRQK